MNNSYREWITDRGLEDIYSVAMQAHSSKVVANSSDLQLSAGLKTCMAIYYINNINGTQLLSALTCNFFLSNSVLVLGAENGHETIRPFHMSLHVNIQMS